jgi:hypothetical protein
MAVTDQEILDNAKNSLNDILLGKVEEFREGSESARTLRIDALEKLISKYEAKIGAASGTIFHPIREVNE